MLHNSSDVRRTRAFSQRDPRLSMYASAIYAQAAVVTKDEAGRVFCELQ